MTTTTIGYTRPLYILPFDHRASFIGELFHWHEPLDAEQTATVADAKAVIFDGFKRAVADGVPKDRAGILVDEQFGAAILEEAGNDGFITAVAVERSGQAEFEFEYGEDFAVHVERFRPTFAKALVRFNPAGDRALNARQATRLHRLSDAAHRAGRHFMFELLVPPEPDQLDRVHGDLGAYARDLRPSLMIDAITALQDASVEPDIWKIEGLDERADCERVVATAQRGGRGEVRCIILGHGSDEATVRSWLRVAAGVPGYTGFAVGRTTWWQPLVDWRAGRSTRDEAVARIALDYREWVDLFEHARPA